LLHHRPCNPESTPSDRSDGRKHLLEIGAFVIAVAVRTLSVQVNSSDCGQEWTLAKLGGQIIRTEKRGG
jgi:hypothetical protein